MATKILEYVRFQHLYKTDAQWSSSNPILLKGEVAYSSDKIGWYKTGDGVSNWKTLQYNTAISASKWSTPRTFTIGNGAKSIDGSGNTSWSLTEIGAAASSHTHTRGQITDFPNALKNPMALTISLNGTSQGAYDGSTAKSINITPGSIGAAPVVGSTSITKLARTITLGSGDACSIFQNGGTYQQKINILDNASTGDNVFEFQQSTNSAGTWSTLLAIRDDGNIVASKFTGLLVGNADTATKLKTARKIGDASFDGTANISLSSIGAAPTSHTHSYLPLSGGNMSGAISNARNGSYVQQVLNPVIKHTGTAGSHQSLYSWRSTNGYFSLGGYENVFSLSYLTEASVEDGVNGFTKQVKFLNENGDSEFPGYVKAYSFSGIGTSLVALNASNISTGTLAAARLPSIARSNTTSSLSPSFGGAFPVLDSVTTDVYGRITKVNTKTITMPSNPNTDTKATQTNTTSGADYRMILSCNANDTTETNTLHKSTNFKANPATGEFYAKGYRRIDITGQTLNVNTLNLATGTPNIMRYIQKTVVGAKNITNTPVSGTPFLLDVEIIRWSSTTDYITMQTFRNYENGTNEYVRYCTNGTWSGWTTRVFTDTRNSAGSTNTSSKIFLIGATSQASNPQTYSHDTVYINTDGHIYSNSKQVVNLSDVQALTNKTYNGFTLAAACTKQVYSRTTVGDCESPTYKNHLIDGSVLSYWNGAYNGTASNLTYCNRGAFGTVVTKNHTDSTSAASIGTGTSIPTERDIYYGLPTINGSHAYTSNTRIYAPTSVGTTGQVMVSTGATPSWSNQNTLSVGAAVKLKNYYSYSSRPTNANIEPDGSGGIIGFKATSEMTENRPNNSHVLHLFWDNTSGWDSQLAVNIGTGHLQSRSMNEGTWKPWLTVLDSGNYGNFTLPKSGGTVTGTTVFSKTTDASGTSNNSPALIVGGLATAAHLELDANEIMAKSNGTSTSPILINGDGGDVYMGNTTSVVHAKGNNFKLANDKVTMQYDPGNKCLNFIFA